MNADQEKGIVKTSTEEKTPTDNALTQKSENLETTVGKVEISTIIKSEHPEDIANGNSDGVESGGNSSGQRDCANCSAKVDGVGAKQPAGKESQKKNANDPYAYVDRGDFTSEKFKIEIRGLPKFYGYGELKRYLNDKLKLSSHKVKPTRKKSPWIFVCFKNEEDRQAALKTLNRSTWKGKMLTASIAKPAPDPLVKKRKLEHESGNVEKRPRISDDERLKNSTTPYWNLSYEEQLKRKYEYVKNIMCNLADLIIGVNPMLTPWIRRQKAKYHGMACEMLDIRKSPDCDGYRNKCEFTIGINEETKQRMVGFRLGSYVQGHVGVGPIDSLKHIPQRMKETVKVFEKFVQASSKEPYNPETHTGHWRLLTLRLTTLGELMAVVVVNSKEVSKAELDSAQKEVKDFFEKGEGKALNVDSLYFQAVGKREAGKEPPMEHILGATHITESLLGLKFRISPEAFFQVNTPGAGVLYSSVGEMIDLNPSTTIVDVCCGTGTIGLSLAKKCGQVLGLEVVAAAIEDAKVNASVNNITNCEFFTGRAEEILTSVLSRAKGKSVYAIVDPPRSGLQQKGIIALRSAEVVEKIVYVSCDPNAALKNFVDLARQTSKTYHGFPLVPICAVPVDMFPHTAHCEVIILFHRVNPINLPKSMPAKKSDAVFLSESLAESPSKEPKPDASAKKDEGSKEGNKEKHTSSESSNTKKHKYSYSSTGGQQGKKFKKTLLSAGNTRPGRFSHVGHSSTSKSGGKQGFGSKSNVSHASRNEPFDRRRGQKRSFEHERPSKTVGQLWREKSPRPWLGDDRRRWKEDDSITKNSVSIWKESPPSHFPKDRTLPEKEYLVPEARSGRSGWKEGGLERENRGWSANTPIKPKWQGMEPRRRENISPVDEVGRRREGWGRGMRDETLVEPKRLRDERGVMVNGPMVERRKLTREDEQLAMNRRGGHDGGGYGPFERNAKDEWPQSSHFRLAESRVTSEPVWQEGRIVQTVEDGIRVDIRRLDADREISPVRERQLSPWNDMRARREDFDDRMDHGERIQEMRSERRQVRDESPDQRWLDGGMAERTENLDEEESYRIRRKFSDLDTEHDRPGFGMMGEHSSRKSCEHMGRVEERSSFDLHQGRRMEMKGDGGSFDSQRSKVMLMERDTMFSRHVEQMDHAPRELPPYRDAHQMPSNVTVSYRDQRIEDGRPCMSPERMNERISIDRSYRKTDSDNYRRSDEIPSSHFSKNEREMPDPYVSSKGRMSSYDKKYESNLPRRDYDRMDKGSRGQSERDLMAMRKIEMISLPFVVSDDYGMEVREPRRSVETSDILLASSKSLMYPSGRFTSHDEGVVKNIPVQKDTLSQIKPWGMDGHHSVMTKASSPVRKIDTSINMYTRGRSMERGGGSWARDRSREEMVGWRDNDKSSSGRGYLGREESNIPETMPTGINYHLPERCNKINLRVASTSIGHEIPTLSPQSIEKSFSFSTARAAIGQHMYNTEEINMGPSMTDVPLYPRKPPEVTCQTRARATKNTSVDSLDRISGMPFRQHSFSHEAPAPTFKNVPLQGSMQLSSLAFRQQIPSLSQIPTINFGQGVTSTVTNSIPSSSMSSPWSNAGISPWEQGHQQRW